MDELTHHAQIVGEHLLKQNLLLTTAESCTGGWIAQAITAVAGSSGWFERGFVTYSNTAKQEMLGVNKQTLIHHGAVSQQTVEEMALGALNNSHAHISVAISGIAGPDGGSPDKPVGTVWIAWAKDNVANSTCYLLSGNREAVRQQAVSHALNGILETLG